jgi:hypothetical protein
MNSKEFGDHGELSVASWLKGRGLKIRLPGKWAPFDLYTEAGTTLEVKVASPSYHNDALGWLFNIQRHGRLCQEDAIDFFVFRFEFSGVLAQFGIDRPLHVVVPSAQVNTHRTVWVSLRSLLTDWGGRANNIDAILESDKIKTARDLAVAILRGARHSSRGANLRKRLPVTEGRISETEAYIRKEAARQSAVDNLIRQIQEENEREARDWLQQEQRAKS